jgi:hypothetical protein
MDLPNDEALRRIVTSFARLRAAHGNAIGDPALVQPTAEFFPDTFRSDGASVDRMFRRMLDYAPLSPELAVELAILVPDEGRQGGCGSAACGTGGGDTAGESSGLVDELDDGYRVLVSAMDVGTPALLGASLARAIGSLVLYEASEPVARPGVAWRARAEESEMAAIVSGFGVLLANGASVWAKSCGGLRMAQGTALGVEEVAVGLALFVEVHREEKSRARKHLGLTQREAFEVASDWVDCNPMLVEALRSRPERLVSGALDLEPVRGVLGQWLHRRKVESAMRAPARRASAPISDERRRRLEEVAALLDEGAESET